jgi:hypothetical protein
MRSPVKRLNSEIMNPGASILSVMNAVLMGICDTVARESGQTLQG